MGVFDNFWTKSSSQEPTQPASGPEVVENLENKPSIEAMETQDQQIDKTEEVDPRPVDSVSPESTPDTTETESGRAATRLYRAVGFSAGISCRSKGRRRKPSV